MQCGLNGRVYRGFTPACGLFRPSALGVGFNRCNLSPRRGWGLYGCVYRGFTPACGLPRPSALMVGFNRCNLSPRWGLSKMFFGTSFYSIPVSFMTAESDGWARLDEKIRHILRKRSKKLSILFAVSKKKSTFVLDFRVINDTRIE